MIFEPGHFFSYSPATINLLLHKAGFKIIKYDSNHKTNIRFLAAPVESILTSINLSTFSEYDYRKVIKKVRINNIKHFFLQPLLKTKFKISKFVRARVRLINLKI